MSLETIAVGVETSGGVERVYVEAERTERGRDGTLYCYDTDDVEVGEFPNAAYVVKADSLE